MEETRNRVVTGIEGMPVYLIAGEWPRDVTTDDFISGVPLPDLLRRLGPDDHLYLVDYITPRPGSIKLTRLI